MSYQPKHAAPVAPIDPKNVNRPDRIELTAHHGTVVRGEVIAVEARAGEVVGFSVRGIGWRYLDDFVAQQDEGVWTLTGHWPAALAPRQGQSGTATLRSAPNEGHPNVRVMRYEESGGSTGYVTEDGEKIPDGRGAAGGRAMSDEEPQTPAEAGWTPEAFDRLRAALNAEPRVKNSQPKPVKGGDERG